MIGDGGGVIAGFAVNRGAFEVLFVQQVVDVQGEGHFLTDGVEDAAIQKEQ